MPSPIHLDKGGYEIAPKPCPSNAQLNTWIALCALAGHQWWEEWLQYLPRLLCKQIDLLAGAVAIVLGGNIELHN